MIDEHQIKQMDSLIQMARFLLTEADSRGLTHGEKHYLIQTALHLLNKAQKESGYRYDLRNEVTELKLDEIPF